MLEKMSNVYVAVMPLPTSSTTRSHRCVLSPRVGVRSRPDVAAIWALAQVRHTAAYATVGIADPPMTNRLLGPERLEAHQSVEASGAENSGSFARLALATSMAQPP